MRVRRADVACFRTGCSIADDSKLCTAKYIVDHEDMNVKDEKVQFESPPLPLAICQAFNVDDLLSSVNNYLYCGRIGLPAALGVHRCTRYPRCKCREADPNRALQREMFMNRYLGRTI